MKELIESPPRTIMQVYKSLPEGTLAELIDNTIYMSPSPIFKHQKTSRVIARQLENLIVDGELGEVITAPFDVFLDEKSNAVQPDIIVVLKENDSIIDREGTIHGAPDLLIEILSASNEKHDTVRKKELYEKFGVKEYWIVDPESKQSIGYTLVGGRYEKMEEETGLIRSLLLGTTFKF